MLIVFKNGIIVDWRVKKIFVEIIEFEWREEFGIVKEWVNNFLI